MCRHTGLAMVSLYQEMNKGGVDRVVVLRCRERMRSMAVAKGEKQSWVRDVVRDSLVALDNYPSSHLSSAPLLQPHWHSVVYIYTNPARFNTCIPQSNQGTRKSQNVSPWRSAQGKQTPTFPNHFIVSQFLTSQLSRSRTNTNKSFLFLLLQRLLYYHELFLHLDSPLACRLIG